MKNIYDYEIFSANISALKNTSFDDTNHQYMTELSINVVKFDNVKKQYICDLKIQNSEIKSNDALFCDNRGNWIFVEFKNGCISKSVMHEIHKKIYDSVLIFMDITGYRLSDLRNQMIYILVYNEDKYIDDNIEPSKKIQESESLDGFTNLLNEYSNKETNKETIKVRIDKFQNYFFKEVHTYTVDEFEQYLRRNNII